MNEQEALRAYFDAHMDMNNAIDPIRFGSAYVKANQARDRLLAGAKPPICAKPDLNPCDCRGVCKRA
jgi:hypothetical protein